MGCRDAGGDAEGDYADGEPLGDGEGGDEGEDDVAVRVRGVSR